MIYLMEPYEFINYFNSFIDPYCLTGEGKRKVIQVFDKHPISILKESLKIGAAQYLRYDNNDLPTKESVEKLINKFGGIAHNLSLPPIDQQISRIKAHGMNHYSKWNNDIADGVLLDFISALRRGGCSEEEIVSYLHNEASYIIYKCYSQNSWADSIKEWTQEWNEYADEHDNSGESQST